MYKQEEKRVEKDRKGCKTLQLICFDNIRMGKTTVEKVVETVNKPMNSGCISTAMPGYTETLSTKSKTFF